MQAIDDPRILEIERTGYLSRLEPIAHRCKECMTAIYEDDEYIEDIFTGDVYCETCFKSRFVYR